jgi:hypothetical protein
VPFAIACGLPDGEKVSFLVDCTFFGSAADSVSNRIESHLFQLQRHSTVNDDEECSAPVELKDDQSPLFS